nr:MAG TPA: hypothetical protein [Caudoviricetes sp.]
MKYKGSHETTNLFPLHQFCLVYIHKHLLVLC